MLLHFSPLHWLIKTPLQSLKTTLSSTSAIFQLPVPTPYLITKPSWESLPTLPSYTPQPPSQFRLYQEPNERGNIVRIDTAIISSCLTRAWSGLSVLTITDFLLLSLRKVMYIVTSDKDTCDQKGKPSPPSSPTCNLLSLLQHLTNNIKRPHRPLQNSCLKATIFILTLAFSHVICASPMCRNGPHLPQNLEHHQNRKCYSPHVLW